MNNIWMLFAAILVALFSTNIVTAEESEEPAINADTGVFMTIRPDDSGADMVLAKCRELSEQGLLADGMTTEDCRNAAIFNEEIENGLVVIFPVTTLGQYAERVAKPLKVKIDEQEKEIATKANEARQEFIKARRAQIAAEAMARLATAKAEKAEAMLKAAAAEAQRIKSEIATLREEKATIASQQEKLASGLDASKRAFSMLSATTEDLRRELSSGLLTQAYSLMKALDDLEASLAYSERFWLLFSAACMVGVLLLAGARATSEARSKIVERVKAESQADSLRGEIMALKIKLAKFSTEPREFSLTDDPTVKEMFTLNAVGFNNGKIVFSFKAECGAFVEEGGINRHLDEIHNDGPTRRARSKINLAGAVPVGTA